MRAREPQVHSGLKREQAMGFAFNLQDAGAGMQRGKKRMRAGGVKKWRQQLGGAPLGKLGNKKKVGQIENVGKGKTARGVKTGKNRKLEKKKRCSNELGRDGRGLGYGSNKGIQEKKRFSKRTVVPPDNRTQKGSLIIDWGRRNKKITGH